ncbi:MAG: type II toxin-antitoxin system death-on-curing family toxin [Alkalinema sp. RL_2_19]|nr:type II toxin-antitoxin system death-on-curing family toxin [Alkalinema sp. RL_2_19]
MQTPKWLDERIVRAIHAQQLAEYGGSPGLRDQGLLLSALAKAQNLFFYGENPPSIFELAAAYGFGISQNHAFVDGNKRVSLYSMAIFLDINGYSLEAPEEEAVLYMLRLADGKESQPALAAWLQKYSHQLNDS